MTNFKRREQNMFGRLVANSFKEMFENIVETHLGCNNLTEKLFIRIATTTSIIVEEYLSKEMEFVVTFLIKKGAHNKSC